MAENDRPQNVEPNVRSADYFVVESKILCLGCNELTRVFAFALPEGYESLEVDDDTDDDDADEAGSWVASDVAAVVSYIESLSDSVLSRIQGVSAHYRLDTHSDSGRTYWMNHREHCGAQMEEEELHGEPEGPFGHTPYEGLEVIRVSRVREPFEAWAGAEAVGDDLPWLGTSEGGTDASVGIKEIKRRR